MIKSSTISKATLKKAIVEKLPIENRKLEIELQKACMLIKDASVTIEDQQKIIYEKETELNKIKSHWLYIFIKWFK